MTFVTAGLAIAGIAAVGIPIIIHLLFRRRRRPIPWAAMRLLMVAFRKHRRRLRLQQILLLATRCLILLLLGLALAQPLLDDVGSAEAGASRAVYLVIDNGLASGVETEAGLTALARHVQQAGEIIESLGSGDLISVITTARPAEPLVSPPSSNHTAVLRLLESLQPSQSPSDIAGAITLLRSSLDELEADRSMVAAYLLSDFRAGSAPLDSPLPSALANLPGYVTLLTAPPADEAASNVQVTDVSPLRGLVLPGQTDGSGQVTVRVARQGGDLGRDVSQVRLLVEGAANPEPKVIEWQPGDSQASIDFQIDFSDQSSFGGFSNRRVGVTAAIDNDVLAPDNTHHLVIDARSRIRVTMIDPRSFGIDTELEQLSAGQWIRRALQPGEASPIDVVDVQPGAVDDRDLRASDVAIVPRPDLISDSGWVALRDFATGGGLVIVMPASETNVQLWVDTFTEIFALPWRIAIEPVEHEDGLVLAEQQPSSPLLQMLSGELTDLTRPVTVWRTLPVQFDPGQAQTILKFNNDEPLVITTTGQVARGENDDEQAQSNFRGLVVFFALTPELSWTNLPTQVFMVPLFQEIVRQGLSLIRVSEETTVGGRPVVSANNSAVEMIGPGETSISLDRSGRPMQPLEQAGVYTLRDAAAQEVGEMAVNVEPAAGRTEVQSADAVLNWLSRSGEWSAYDPTDPVAPLRTADTRTSLAGILLIILVALALIETLLARRFSYAYRTGAAIPDSRSNSKQPFVAGGATS